MRRRLLVLATTALVLAGIASAVLSTRATDASARPEARKPRNGQHFVGYWMGIDPLDGGDSRRGITRNGNRTLSVIGRDTAFTLCDGTDKAVITMGDARVVGQALTGDDFLITCFGNGQTVDLKVRYDVLDANVIRETTTTQAGEPVDQIIFHRVSDL